MSNETPIRIVDLVVNQTGYGCIFASTPISLVRGNTYEIEYASDSEAKVEVVFSSSEITPASFVVPAHGRQRIFVSPGAISADLGKTAVIYNLSRITPFGNALFTWKPFPVPIDRLPGRPDVEIDDP